MSGLRVSDNLPAAVAARAKRVLGHVLIDRARPRAALATYQEALTLNEGLEGPNSTAVAEAYVSIACAYIELEDVEQAFAYLEKATAIHMAHDPRKTSRTFAVRAMACLRAGDADEALAALHERWRLQGMTQGQIEASNHPKNGGDILLLVRILWLQGKRADAFNLVERVIAMRTAADGESSGLRFWDALFIKSRMQDEDGKPSEAATTVRRVVEIDVGEYDRELDSQRARARWFFARYSARAGAHAASDQARKCALRARGAIKEREWPDEDTDEGFMRLVPWMMW